jgi:hypothetical protein
MIKALRELDTPRQRQLIRLLEPRAELEDIDDADVLSELLRTLRRVLEVPEKDDLPEYLRRRLVEVTRRQFRLLGGHESDAFSDMELAQLLVDFVLDAAATLAEDDERRLEFETFLRTKDRTDRTRWLVHSDRLAALTADRAFDRAAAERRAEELLQEQSAHQKTAKAIVADLAAVTRTKSKRRRAQREVQGVAVGSALSQVVAATAVGGVAVAPAVAIPLAAVAGGLYMSGRGQRELIKVAEEEAPRAKANRARRSRLVQSVVALSAFMVANAVSERE